jgi:type IV pilus assembly protein PilB
MGIYEAFEVTTPIQDLILNRATTAEIQKAAQAEGMITMREDGYLKAMSGRTTLHEIDRVASADAS